MATTDQETNYKIMPGYDCLNKCNFSFRRKSGKECAAVHDVDRKTVQNLGPCNLGFNANNLAHKTDFHRLVNTF